MAVVVGLTGGIGSGKSTVADLLVARGAILVDADRIVREIQQPGGAAYDGIVERFGTGVLADDGTIDRPALAAVAFADEESRQALNALIHPHVGRIMAERVATAPDDAIVVMDIPLLAERGERARDGFALVVVVDAPVDEAVRRLVAYRGFSEEDARARVAVQTTREQRRAIADVVIDNSGDIDGLERQVDALWGRLRALVSQPG